VAASPPNIDSERSGLLLLSSEPAAALHLRL
jgi:hypothetical protein